jgi:L-ribulokinase
VSSRCALGLDFGTASARALVLDIGSGVELGAATSAYASGTIEERPGWALQDPRDWLAAMGQASREAVAAAGVSAEDVGGVGVAFTSSTVLPVLADGTPLCLVEAWSDEPHAWPKLWKHHAAQPQADEMTELAIARGERWIERYGGRISSEWLVPKVMQIVDESPAVLTVADLVLEAGDWIAWRLTGTFARNACAAGFKGLWHKHDGYPSAAFLASLRPELELFHSEHGRGRVTAPGSAAGTLTAEAAAVTGLLEGTPVATPTIDAHAGAIGAGVHTPGTLYMALGTSTCQLLMDPREQAVPGIAGIVEDGIVPGLFAYEAGQAAAGDVLDWCVRQVDLDHDVLVERAAQLAPGEHGLLALDWWNGCRTPLADSDLTGAVLGWRLSSTAADLYRALVEATAFGARLVMETMVDAGLSVAAIRVGGGPARNELLLQIYADVLGLPVDVEASGHPSARGAAVLGAAATRPAVPVAETVRSMAPEPARTVEPDPRAGEVYGRLHSVYRDLVETLGRDPSSPLRRLAAIRAGASASDLVFTPHERHP